MRAGLSGDQIGARLRFARQSCELEPHEVGELADVRVSIGDLERWEAGQALPSPVVLQKLLKLYGWTVETLFRSDRAPAKVSGYGLLFRTRREHPVLIKQLPEISEAVCALREAALLEGRLTMGRPWPPPDLRGWHQVARRAGEDWEVGRECARWAREKLGLGSAPVRSVADVLRKIGIRLCWASWGDDGPRGLSVVDPDLGPGVVVNLDPEPQWWVRRLTLAHELCHCLFHRTEPRAFGGICRETSSTTRRSRTRRGGSASKRRSSRKGTSLNGDSLERRAGAFAIYFLAPTEQVDAFMQGLGIAPKAGEVKVGIVHQVMNYFGIGFEACLNHLANCDWVSYSEREALASAPRPSLPPSSEASLEGPDPLFMNREIFPFLDPVRAEVASLAILAWERGLLSEGSLRSCWGASPFDDLSSTFARLRDLGRLSGENPSSE